jgi:hypothetical protein
MTLEAVVVSILFVLLLEGYDVDNYLRLSRPRSIRLATSFAPLLDFGTLA